MCRYLISGELCLCGKEKILMKDIGNNCARCLSYESEQGEEFDADEADYEDL